MVYAHADSLGSKYQISILKLNKWIFFEILAFWGAFDEKCFE